MTKLENNNLVKHKNMLADIDSDELQLETDPQYGPIELNSVQYADHMLISHSDVVDEQNKDMVIEFPALNPSLLSHIPEQRPTTITAVSTLNGSINHQLAFSLLPIFNRTKHYINNPTFDIREYSNPYNSTSPPEAGEITSLRNKPSNIESMTRGYDTGTKAFRNSVTIDLSMGPIQVSPRRGRKIKTTQGKKISIKLTETKIQMCGATSMEMILRAVYYITHHLMKIQSIVNKFEGDPELTKRTVNWVVESLKGELFLILSGSPGDSAEIQHDMKTDVLAINPPPYVDHDMARYMLDRSLEFSYLEQYQTYLNWLLKVRQIYSINTIINKQPNILCPINVQTAMVNMNYELGYKIRLTRLAKLISQEHWPFFVRYNPLYDKYLNVYFRCTPNDCRGQVRYCTLMVYLKGSVTQSNPTIHTGQLAYRAFMIVMEKIRDQVAF